MWIANVKDQTDITFVVLELLVEFTFAKHGFIE